MKIGILNADTVELPGASSFGQYPEMFSRIFWAVDPTIQFETYEVQFDHYPKKIDDCDAYLITGSKASAYDKTNWIDKLKKFIQTLHQNKIKLIGICFGHQVVAEALGGSVKNSSKGWHVGVDSISLFKQIFEFDYEYNEFNLIFSHQDEVISLPETAKLIAGSKICPNGMFVIDDHILCTQGHIELHKDFAKLIYDFRKNQIGNAKYLSACETLTEKTDELAVVNVLLKFIKN
tara:strand:- start:595 stop:1296 length:702 start_codon:yes stop_codon:yes gene_type:complete